jgi:hypothetical protein
MGGTDSSVPRRWPRASSFSRRAKVRQDQQGDMTMVAVMADSEILDELVEWPAYASPVMFDDEDEDDDEDFIDDVDDEEYLEEDEDFLDEEDELEEDVDVDDEEEDEDEDL